MNELTDKQTRNRTAYNRALKAATDAWWKLTADDVNYTPWDTFRPQFIKQYLGGISQAPRGRKPSANATSRQQYQRTYQAARRRAYTSWLKTPTLRAQHAEFTEYWKDKRESWLPTGFFKDRKPLVTPQGRSYAKDRLAKYQTVYRLHARKWEMNAGEINETFGYSWALYWEYNKAQAFPEIEKPDFPNAVEFRANAPSSLNGGVYFSYIPDGWLGANKVNPLVKCKAEQLKAARQQAEAWPLPPAPPLTSVSPITHAATCILLVPDDTHMDIAANDDTHNPWIAAT